MALSTLMEAKDRRFRFVLEEPVEGSKAAFSIYLYLATLNIMQRCCIHLCKNILPELPKAVRFYWNPCGMLTSMWDL